MLLLAACSVLFVAACDNGSSGGAPLTGKEHGQAVFTRYCGVCHPGGNAGSGPSLVSLGPRLTDAQIQNVVRHGKNRMPGYSQGDIPDNDLADLVLYIRSLK